MVALNKHFRDYATNTTVLPVKVLITVVENLAERLKWLRLARKLSQQQLADAAGVSQGTIGNAEAGIRKSIREIGAVCEALGTTPQWLQHGKGMPPVISDADNVTDITPDGKQKVTGRLPSGAESVTPKTIPTEMIYEPEYLSSTVLLLGNLLGALDARSRRSIGTLLHELSEKPDDREDIAERVVANARVSNKVLDRTLQGSKRPQKTESPT